MFKYCLLFVFLSSSVNAFIRRDCKDSNKANCNYGDHEVDEYDFIIVGGGLAGCTVAARLSEIPGFKVLLLEAGGKPPLIALVPMLTFFMLQTTNTWNFTSIPQKNSNNRIFDLLQGRMLGGTANINVMTWFRANKHDFDLWQKLGAKGWSWENVLRYYRSSETDYTNDAEEHISGFNGPLTFTNPWKNVTLFSSFNEEMQKLGYNYNNPSNGIQTGFSIFHLTVFESLTQTSYTNYLIPALERNNLKVITEAMVEKVIFNNRNEAVGVTYSKDGKKHKVTAKREVILSAGAINTPQILMLSGIGHKNHLKTFNIEVISDLPVGDNFQDHIAMVSNFSKPNRNIYTKMTMKQFFENKGPLTNFSSVNAFIHTDLSNDITFPDVQLFLYGQFLDPISDNIVYQLWWQIQRPKSKGTIRLQSKNPNEQPVLDPNYLNDEYDMNIMLRLSQNIASIGSRLNTTQNEYSLQLFDTSKCEHLDSKTDDYWRCVVRSNIQIASDYCCTARMGSKDDKAAVVDSELKVIGVKNLRVIDASVMPSIPSASLQATIVMIAEKGSSLIKKDHLNSLLNEKYPIYERERNIDPKYDIVDF